MKETLSKVIYKLLRPIVTIIMRKGIAFGEFSQVAKSVYIEVAEEQLLQAEGKATTSRISIMTGLTRKDVGALRKNKSEDGVITDVSQKYNRSVRVISAWLEDNEFCTEHGYPRTLLIHGDIGSFESLVVKYSGDMPVRAMLDELKRVGVLEVIGTDHVSLLRHAYIPEGDETEKLSILGEDVPLLIATIDNNINGEKIRFQRKVCYNNLPPECLDDFQKKVNIDGQHLLEKFNEWLIKHDRGSELNTEDSGRMKAGVGIFYFQQEVDTKKIENPK